MNSKERRKLLESLRIKLETLRFTERGGIIEKLKDEVVLQKQGARDHILVPRNAEIEMVFVIDEALERRLS